MSLPISGFMPIPLAIMPPFMAYQSLVMGDAFGRAFQFGKRKISAMSNEEFNKLDVVTMFESISNEYTRMIPTVEKSMAQSTELQLAIVKEMLKIIPALGQMLLSGVQDAASGTIFEHPLHGHLFGHDDTSTTTTETPTTTTETPTTTTTEIPTVTTEQRNDEIDIDEKIKQVNFAQSEVLRYDGLAKGSDNNLTAQAKYKTERAKWVAFRDAFILELSQMHYAYFQKWGNWYSSSIVVNG